MRTEVSSVAGSTRVLLTGSNELMNQSRAIIGLDTGNSRGYNLASVVEPPRQIADVRAAETKWVT